MLNLSKVEKLHNKIIKSKALRISHIDIVKKYNKKIREQKDIIVNKLIQIQVYFT